MKTPPDLPSGGVDSSWAEQRGNWQKAFEHSAYPPKLNQLGSVSATKDAGLSRTAAHMPRGYTARGRNVVDRSTLPVKGHVMSTPDRIRMGKWGFYGFEEMQVLWSRHRVGSG